MRGMDPRRSRFFRRGSVLGAGGLLVASLVVGLSQWGSTAHAAFPGQNAKILCSGAVDRVAVPADDSEIYTLNPDGSGRTFLTNNGPLTDPADPTSALANDNEPAFSPDGKKVAWSSVQAGSPEIWTMDADGTNQTRLTFAPGLDAGPNYSPDGKQIVFNSARDLNNEVYKMNADGSGQTRLTFDGGTDAFASWSPDGTRIALHSQQPVAGATGPVADFEIYTMDTNGGAVKRLTTSLSVPGAPAGSAGAFQGFDFAPEWSPDGKKLVFRTHRDGNSEIYTMNSADGSGLTRLTNDVSDPLAPFANLDDFPAWSPDGTRIVFNSTRSGEAPANNDVYTIRAADGSDLKRLTTAVGSDRNCDWGRIPPLPAPPARPVTPVSPVPKPSAGKRPSSLTLRARPKRDRRLPFKYAFSGRVRLPAGTSAAQVCSGKVRLRLTKGEKTVATGTATLSKACTYKRKVTIRSAKKTGRRKGKLKVRARFGGNAFLKGSKKSTTVRFF